MEIRKQAEKEVAEEIFRKSVDREKERVRLRKSFWIRLFPWRVVIERRDWHVISKNEAIARACACLRKNGCRVREDYGVITIEMTGGK